MVPLCGCYSVVIYCANIQPRRDTVVEKTRRKTPEKRLMLYPNGLRVVYGDPVTIRGNAQEPKDLISRIFTYLLEETILTSVQATRLSVGSPEHQSAGFYYPFYWPQSQ